MAIVILLLVLGTGGGMVIASNEALPGDRLYPVKLGLEEVRLTTANDAADVELQAAFAARRLAEVEALIAAGRLQDIRPALNRYQTHVDGAVDALTHVNAENAALFDRLDDTLSRQRAELADLAGTAPADAQSQLQEALDASENAQEVLEEIAPDSSQPPSPTPSSFLAPTEDVPSTDPADLPPPEVAQAEPPHPTNTPQPTPEPENQPEPTAEPTPEPEPTAEPEPPATVDDLRPPRPSTRSRQDPGRNRPRPRPSVTPEPEAEPKQPTDLEPPAPTPDDPPEDPPRRQPPDRPRPTPAASPEPEPEGGDSPEGEPEPEGGDSEDNPSPTRPNRRPPQKPPLQRQGDPDNRENRQQPPPRQRN